mmetsp:Transcript_137951/g.440572  ORF Transcript_137951/g.440572 Transcript_137951/m.440572 type:complete len:1566 (+) Transcript_137951:62-4759(+)
MPAATAAAAASRPSAVLLLGGGSLQQSLRLGGSSSSTPRAPGAPPNSVAASDAAALAGRLPGGGAAASGATGLALVGMAAAAAVRAGRRRLKTRGRLAGAPLSQRHLQAVLRVRDVSRQVGLLPSALSTTMGKKEIKQTISWQLMNHGIERSCEFLDDLKELGFSWATRAGVSLGVDDMSVPLEKAAICQGTSTRTLGAERSFENGDITVVEKFLKITDEWTKASEAVKDKAMANFRENDPTNPVYMMSNSGARGNVSQVRQLLAMRGLMADANGQLIDVPITHCLREGMTVTDMLISGHGARKGCIDTALRTADSGYLYRRMDFAASSTVIKCKDCGSPEFTEVHPHVPDYTSASLKDRIRGRTLSKDLVDPVDQEVLFKRGHLLTEIEAGEVASRWKKHADNKVEDLPPILVRTPLTCKLEEGLCAMCYGEDLSTPSLLARNGLPVGTIAAQSMGEPGTQLTMRTFHTGGAFEGKGGKGIKAVSAGTVQLHSDKNEAINRFYAEQEDVKGIGKWFRNSWGDLACSLVCQAMLKIVAGDGVVVQETQLAKGSVVRVMDGDSASLGQVLYEEPVDDDGKVDEANVDKLDKYIMSEESGEVVLQQADFKKYCLQPGSQLIWVLQGSFSKVESAENCTLSVRQGDIVTKGMPLAEEWTAATSAGVPRFQTVQRNAGAVSPDAATGAASGWRGSDWEAAAEVIDGPRSTCALDGDLGSLSRRENELHLSMDFDWFPLAGGRVTEYHARGSLPSALLPKVDNIQQKKKGRLTTSKRAAPLPKLPPKAATSLPPIPVYASSPFEGGRSSSDAPGSVCVACSPPSSGAAGVVKPASRTARPEHVMPIGGLVLRLPEAGRRLVAWAPEEIHSVGLQAHLCEGLDLMHGQPHFVGMQVMASPEISVLTPSVDGVFCLYESNDEKAVVVEEDDGIVRRESWDRLRRPTSGAKGFKQVECVVKPGFVFACPSWHFDETWFAAAKGEHGGVHLHQKLIPPGVDFIKGLEGVKSEEWRIVELLDAPGKGDEVVRVLVRPVEVVDVPQDTLPKLPEDSKMLTSWYLPYADGEVVRSLGPVALAYQVTSSVARSPAEPHCTTAVPRSSVEPVMAPEDAIAAMAEAISQAVGGAGGSASGSSRLRPTREWNSGEICAVQHTPAAAPMSFGEGDDQTGEENMAEGGSSSASSSAAKRASRSAAWRLAQPRHLGVEEAAAGSASSAVAVPQRQLPSPVSGLVVRAGAEGAGPEGGGVSDIGIVGVLGEEDLVQVRCQHRPSVLVGDLVRRGEPLSESAEDVAPRAGQVLMIEQDRGDDGSDGGFVVTMRRGSVYLVTKEGRITVRNGEIVNKGDRLGIEALSVPKTSDIVQGLPKIEKLFEARGGLVQVQLQNLLNKYEKEGLGNLKAAMLARDKVQQDLVAEIGGTYLDQGVFINPRHIEVVVRKMTAKCEILEAVGASGMLPGSLVDYREIEMFMAVQPSGEFRIKPLVRGLTQLGLDSHVLVSMGFREVDNVLTQSIMSGKPNHSMDGIKENLMVGKRINVGTNSSKGAELWESAKRPSSLALNKIPQRGARISIGHTK